MSDIGCYTIKITVHDEKQDAFEHILDKIADLIYKEMKNDAVVISGRRDEECDHDEE